MRSQNQLTITIGKIMNLTLEQFSNVSLFQEHRFVLYVNHFSTDFMLMIILQIIRIKTKCVIV